ncbi:hypothetical protein [Salinibacterium sp. ZJ77]|uniref:hypothetical protein n=1 Tax=Salinibacterium sp. ZJ77 TaxID=2708337 RepID=UPI001421C7AE|nr:hypothetical protein [Salinibacterium sp. ZJ77]
MGWFDDDLQPRLVGTQTTRDLSDWLLLAVLPVQLSERDAITYSYVAAVGLADLYASFRDPEGRPALDDARLRWRARST